jgi:hypothetical protein
LESREIWNSRSSGDASDIDGQRLRSRVSD